MTISSINTNLAALLAQSNIGVATQNSSNDVAALSSGNRIVSASTDVAALAAGTALVSQVNVLNTALTVASQGSSLLQVADGALAQIQSILQRQQAITTSAQSGSLSSTQLGFLDQEFQSLTSEIDQLASSTNFNGVNLIDGSLGAANSLRSVGIGSTSANASATVSGFTASGLVTAISYALNSTTANDTAFIGDLSKGVFQVTGDDTGAGSLSVGFSINGANYTGSISSVGTSLVLSDGNSAVGGSITFTLTAPGAASDGTVQSNLSSALSGATAYSIRHVATVLASNGSGGTIAGSAITTTAAQGALLSGFSGSDVVFQSQTYNGVNEPQISDFTASGTGVGQTLSVTVNGTVYTTQAATTNAGGITGAKYGPSGTTAGQVVFYANGDTTSKEQLTLNFGTSVAGSVVTAMTGDQTNLTTTAGTNAFLSGVNSLFGSGGGTGGLTFQVGSNATQTINVSLGSASSATLFQGVSQNVLTTQSATTAASAVTTALNTVTALRATVGAGEERFNFASSAISSASQNENAARSTLLDTDVASTSTNFATAQVQLQAGIAVLAQANQLQQNLLKLIA